jgi:hypothetical protein
MAICENKYFIIKESGTGAYVFLHSNKKDISTEFTSIGKAMKFTQDEIKFIYDNFKSVWERDGYQVYELEITEVRNPTWFLQPFLIKTV